MSHLQALSTKPLPIWSLDKQDGANRTWFAENR
jgi:hypothetical protein